MSLEDDKDGDRRRKSPDESDRNSDTESDAAGSAGAVRKKRRPAAPEVGQALRSAYQRTLDENIPPEMLDLLGKLG